MENGFEKQNKKINDNRQFIHCFLSYSYCRKVRLRNAQSGRYAQEETQATCRNLSIWLAILMSNVWLFILSYMLAVVHTENRRLEVEIKQGKFDFLPNT